MKNSTMSDVAKEAGVALTTVGRVINGGYVSSDKRERVEAAIQKLGYVPNKMARALKASESKLIGVYMTFNENQVFVSIADGVIRAIDAAGYGVFSLTSYTNAFEKELDEFISRKVDALIMISMPRIEPKLIEKVQNAGIPVVMIERCRNLPKVDGVYVNDIGGAENCTAGMIYRGRKKVAFVGCRDVGTGGVEQERKDGYLKALKETGLKANDDLIIETNTYRRECGYEAAKKLIGSGKDFDAVFCTSDMLAAGFMQYLYEKNIRVPDDVMVSGYDDNAAKFLAPPISSVALDVAKMGTEAVNFALTRIKDPELQRREVRVNTLYTSR